MSGTPPVEIPILLNPLHVEDMSGAAPVEIPILKSSPQASPSEENGQKKKTFSSLCEMEATEFTLRSKIE
jgi:hypothetical protein